ncbi:MAG: hypothetical protein WCH84_07615, partial [Verrucomicrobiota bacterium]
LKSVRGRIPVVLTTAFSEHAVEAFDAEAVDYLLKPITASRLGRALDRILLKSEMFLDATFYIHEHLHGLKDPAITFIPAYDFLKHQLVEQMDEVAVVLPIPRDANLVDLTGSWHDPVQWRRTARKRRCRRQVPRGTQKLCLRSYE